MNDCLRKPTVSESYGFTYNYRLKDLNEIGDEEKSSSLIENMGLQMGDKITGRYGNRSVIGDIYGNRKTNTVYIGNDIVTASEYHNNVMICRMLTFTSMDKEHFYVPKASFPLECVPFKFPRITNMIDCYIPYDLRDALIKFDELDILYRSEPNTRKRKKLYKKIIKLLVNNPNIMDVIKVFY